MAPWLVFSSCPASALFIFIGMNAAEGANASESPPSPVGRWPTASPFTQLILWGNPHRHSTTAAHRMLRSAPLAAVTHRRATRTFSALPPACRGFVRPNWVFRRLRRHRLEFAYGLMVERLLTSRF